MTTLTWLFFGMAFFAGFLCAWHWQRSKYEKVLRILGDKAREGLRNPA